jgi:uncharacterized paraquat-inducible protein A
MTTLHNRCGAPVTYTTVSSGYSAECPKCDEDLYKFETHEEEQ